MKYWQTSTGYLVGSTESKLGKVAETQESNALHQGFGNQHRSWLIILTLNSWCTKNINFFTGHLRIYDNLSLHIGVLKCNQFPFLANIPQPRFLRWRELYPVRLNETCSDEVLGRPIPQHSHCQPNSVQRTHEEVISSSYGGSRGAGSRSDFPRRRMQFWVSQGEPTALPPARRPSRVTRSGATLALDTGVDFFTLWPCLQSIRYIWVLKILTQELCC